MVKEETKPPRKRSLKNNKQLRLSKQNEVLALRLMLQYQLDKATTCDWTWFGNHLLQLGMVSLKKNLTQSLSHKERLNQMVDDLKKKGH